MYICVGSFGILEKLCGFYLLYPKNDSRDGCPPLGSLNSVGLKSLEEFSEIDTSSNSIVHTASTNCYLDGKEVILKIDIWNKCPLWCVFVAKDDV